MIESRNTNKNPVEMPGLGFKISDIYYVLFRRKWVILGFFSLGVVAALVLALLQRPTYSSEAKLMIRYVVDNKSMDAGNGNNVKDITYGGEMVLNSELEILTSMDLCKEVAELVGPDKILAKEIGGSNVVAAATIIYKNILVENPRRSNIVKVRFSHREPEVCRDVLTQLIEAYLRRHKAIHRDTSGFDDVLSGQSQTLLVRIRQNEEKVTELRNQAGVSSVEDSKKALNDQLGRLQQQIFDAESQLVEMQAILKALPGSSPARNEKDAQETETSPEKVSEYKSICNRLEVLRNKQFELEGNLTEENPQVVRIRNQITDTEKRKKALETENPKLLALYIPRPASPVPVASSQTPLVDPSRINGLVSKILVYSNQMALVRSNLARIDSLAASIGEVELKLGIDKQNFRQVSEGLERARLNEVVSNGKLSNIQRVQEPTPPAPNVTQRLKVIAGAIFGGLVLGFGLAFVIEFLFVNTVRRVSDLESKLHIPTFLTIPKMGLNGHARLLPLAVDDPESPERSGGSTHDLSETWATDHPLRPYVDGLRDRTLSFFEGDVHKPKLIGITGCRKGSGVTSIAAGLAGALSETGDGNVLLLDLNTDSQAVHPFYRGELSCGLSDALESDKRNQGKVLQNLYVATAGNPSDSESRSLSKHLSRVVPKLRVSDYDYIVFDLPPTTPTSMTARLAGMMDLVVLVVESEKDSQESVKQAGKLLARSKARVSAVLNKVQNPVPQWLDKGA